MLIVSRSYKGLSSYRLMYSVKGNKEHEESLVITLVNSGGFIEFEIIDVETKESNKLTNPESGTYTFAINKGGRLKIILRAKGSSGSYKIEKIRCIKSDEI